MSKSRLTKCKDQSQVPHRGARAATSLINWKGRDWEVLEESEEEQDTTAKDKEGDRKKEDGTKLRAYYVLSRSQEAG